MKKILYAFLIILISMPIGKIFAEPKPEIEKHSVVVLGSGVGALTSAIYLQRAGIQTLVIEGPTPGGAIAQSPMVHNWPGEVAISGQNLAEKIRKQAEVNGAKFLSHEVVSVEMNERPFTIHTRDTFDSSITKTIQADACIVAVGSKPKFLGVPGESGEKGYWTKGVYSCAVCDGNLYKDRTVAVIGGGDSAIIEADYLSNIAKKVYVILRSDQFRTVENRRKDELLKKENVEVIYQTKIFEIAGNGQKVTHLKLSTEKQLPVDGVFIAIGATPNTQFFNQQIALDSKGYIQLQKGQESSVHGVYAIGDVVDPHYKQAVSAAGDGAKAALEVEHFLASLPAKRKKSMTQIIQPIQTVASQSGANGSVYDVKSQKEFYEAINQPAVPVVVDFYSPYCGPCKRIAPKVKEMAKKYAGKIDFIKVNVAELNELADAYNIYGVPTVIVFDTQGKAVNRGVGPSEIAKIFNQLDQYVSN